MTTRSSYSLLLEWRVVLVKCSVRMLGRSGGGREEAAQCMQGHFLRNIVTVRCRHNIDNISVLVKHSHSLCREVILSSSPRPFAEILQKCEDKEVRIKYLIDN